MKPALVHSKIFTQVLILTSVEPIDLELAQQPGHRCQTRMNVCSQ